MHFGIHGKYWVSHALEQVFYLVTDCNVLIDAKAPWKLAKNPNGRDQLDSVL